MANGGNSRCNRCECMDENNSSMAADRLRVMYRQEDRYARDVSDYLNDPADARKITVNEDCRRKMFDWCLQVADFCRLSEETACSAITLLDRFLSRSPSREYLRDRKEFQLAAMSSFFVAAKSLESTEIESSLLEDLSRGMFDGRRFVEMEMEMLEALEWRVCSPSSVDFVENLLELSKDSAISAYSLRIRKYCGRRARVAAGEYAFVTRLPSEIALAAILNAFADLDVPLSIRKSFLADVSTLQCADCGPTSGMSDSVEEVREMLRRADRFEMVPISKQGYLSHSASTSELLPERGIRPNFPTKSPKSVIDGPHPVISSSA